MKLFYYVEAARVFAQFVRARDPWGLNLIEEFCEVALQHQQPLRYGGLGTWGSALESRSTFFLSASERRTRHCCGTPTIFHNLFLPLPGHHRFLLYLPVGFWTRRFSHPKSWRAFSVGNARLWRTSEHATTSNSLPTAPQGQSPWRE